MSNISFSLKDYQDSLASGNYKPPEILCPYFEVDQVLYRTHEIANSGRGNLYQAWRELQKRTGQQYFRKTYPLQTETLGFSARAFPAYRFILPEVITEDWLAIVDWGKFHRDHTLHQPLCGYIVLKLLDGDGQNGPIKLPGGQSILDLCVDYILKWEETAYIRDFLLSCGMSQDDQLLDSNSTVARKIWHIFFREIAYVAAVFHDIGYPWQYAGLIQDNLDGMNTPAVKQNRSAEQVIKLFGHRLLFYALNGYQKVDAACPSTWHKRVNKLVEEALIKTHGFPGALGFLYLNDCVRKYPNNLQSPLHLLCIEWAAVAIMMHDMCKIYWDSATPESKTPKNPFLRLDFRQDPLSSIIALVDIIQEFERPAVKYGKCKDRVTLDYPISCESTELDIDNNGELTLRYKMATSQMCAIKRKTIERERYKHFNNQYGYIDISSIGIKSVRSICYL